MTKKHHLLFLLIGFISFGIFVVACKKDNPEPYDQGDLGTVNSYLRFSHEVDHQPVEFDTVIYINDFGNKFSIETIRYFISTIVFIKSNNDIVNIDEVIYVDPRDDGYNKKLITNVIPNGQYTKMQFIFGLDSSMNQTGLFNNFPETAMEWPLPMGGGYHYMKLEGKCEDLGSYNVFNFHTGPLNNNQNYFLVELPINLNVSKGSFDITLTMEIQNWFRSPNLFDLTSISSGMMGDQAMQVLVKNNGHDVFTVE